MFASTGPKEDPILRTSANEYSRHYSGRKNTRVRRNPVLFKSSSIFQRFD